jgi:hypothetical protein
MPKPCAGLPFLVLFLSVHLEFIRSALSAVRAEAENDRLLEAFSLIDRSACSMPDRQ